MNENFIYASEKKLLPYYSLIMDRKGPFTVLVAPTNKCNLKCKFCGVSNRDKDTEIDLTVLKNILDRLGNVSIQLTGGGEPLMYKNIDALIDLCSKYNGLGMITNGTLIHRIKDRIKNFQWLRISINSLIDDGRHIEFDLIPASVKYGLTYCIHNNSPTDFMDRINKLNTNAKYIRLVKDYHDKIEKTFTINNDKIHYIKESESSNTDGLCHLGSIRPIILPNGKLYPCCYLSLEGNNLESHDDISIEDIKNWSPYKCTIKSCPQFKRELFLREILNHKDEDKNFI